MRKPRVNKDRERRIEMEIVVDAYGPDERAGGWYAYLEDSLAMPFTAVCRAKRAVSPLQVRDEVEVIDMAPDKECRREMFVMIRWERHGLAVPLSQLKAAGDAGDATRTAVEDWFYWASMGYEF